MADYKRFYETALAIGERHSKRIVAQAVEIQKLRRAIWRAVIQLRAGHADGARQILERQIKEDQLP